LQVFYHENKVGQGKIKRWEDLQLDAIKRNSFESRRRHFLESLLAEQKCRLNLLSDKPRDDSKGEKPGDERGDEEHRMFLAALSWDEDRQFLESHEGLGGSQKAEVAWLERRFAETGNKGYRYAEVDVRHFGT
jgi:hypothetical protein